MSIKEIAEVAGKLDIGSVTDQDVHDALCMATYDGRKKEYSVEKFRTYMLKASAILMALGNVSVEEIITEHQRQFDLWGDAFDRKNTANDWHAYAAHYLNSATKADAETNYKKAAAICQAAVLMVDVYGGPAPRHYDDGFGDIPNDVLEAIVSERAYQDKLSDRKLSVAEELLVMEEYILRARKTWSDTFGDFSEAPTWAVIRKIVATGIRCLTNHGAVNR
jgi:hypothetical protein